MALRIMSSIPNHSDFHITCAETHTTRHTHTHARSPAPLGDIKKWIHDVLRVGAGVMTKVCLAALPFNTNFSKSTHTRTGKVCILCSP